MLLLCLDSGFPEGKAVLNSCASPEPSTGQGQRTCSVDTAMTSLPIQTLPGASPQPGPGTRPREDGPATAAKTPVLRGSITISHKQTCVPVACFHYVSCLCSNTGDCEFMFSDSLIMPGTDTRRESTCSAVCRERGEQLEGWRLRQRYQL